MRARPALSVSVFRLGKTVLIASGPKAFDAIPPPLGRDHKTSRVLLSQRCQLPRSREPAPLGADPCDRTTKRTRKDPLCVPLATAPGRGNGGSRRS
jgi:hypothetical protein